MFQGYNCSKTRLYHKCFPDNFFKVFKTSNFYSTCEELVLHSCYWVGRNLKNCGNQNEHKIYPASKYCSPGRPTPTISGRPLRILFHHPGDVPIWRPLEDLQNTSLGQIEAISGCYFLAFWTYSIDHIYIKAIQYSRCV